MKRITIKWIAPALMLTLLISLSSVAQTGWQEINTGFSYIWMNIEFPAAQNQIGYVSGENVTYNGIGKVLKTTDGGANWTDISPASLPGIEGMAFVDLNTGFIGGWQNYFAKTTDGGTTWIPMTIDPGIWYIKDIVFRNANNGVVATGDPAVWVTSDGGASWTEATGLSSSVHKLAYATDSILFAACGDEKILKSTDGGLSWTQVYSGIFTYVFLGVDFLDANYGFVGGEDGKVLKTTDGGTNWTITVAGPSYHMWRGIHIYNTDSTYVCGTTDGIYKTNNGATSWVSDYTSSAGRALYDIEFTNDNTGYVACSQGIILKKGASLTANFTASDTTICTGETVTFTNLSSASATSYNWTFEGGTPATSTAMNPIITYNSTGDFDVTLQVSDGSQTATTIKQDYISIATTPVQPSTPTGDTTACQNSIKNYTTVSVPGAATYNWIVEPASAGTFSGNGTTGTLSTSNNWTGSYIVKVQAQNSCGTSSSSPTLSCTLYLMPQSFNITGEGGYCEGEPGAELGLDGSESGVDYELFLDGVSTGITVPGTGSAISFGYQTAEGDYTSTGFAGSCSNYMGGVVTVQMFTFPGAASTPAGPSIVCNSEVSLYTTTAAEADTIIWTLTPATAGTMTPSGFQVEIAWSASYTGTAQLSCFAENPCGTGTPSPDLDIQVEVAPDPVITGEDLVCQGEMYDYETEDVAGNTYSWEVTGGEIVTGSGTNMISVEWEVPGAGIVSVEEAIPGGCSTIAEFPVTIVICTAVEESAPIELSLYPNPVTDLLNISYNSLGKDKVYFQLFTLLGKEAWSAEKMAGAGTLQCDLSGLQAGLYLLKIQSGDKIATSRVMKH